MNETSGPDNPHDLDRTTPLRGSTPGSSGVSPSGRPEDARGRFVPGTLFGKRYRIVSLLGRGGMGEVYRAEDLELGQTVALKLLPLALKEDQAALERFRSEVRLARQVTHPNVCRVYDIGEVEGQRFLSMEYVDGEDLASVLRRLGRPTYEKALDIARQICSGLATAHDIGILHRDLKPANIMLDGKGQVRIMDFGLAGLADELKDSRETAGTLAYMAPEQLAGEGSTVRSDVYSLGLVLHEVFSGERAFAADTLVSLTEQQKSGAPPLLSRLVPGIAPEVERIVHSSIQIDQDKRPASVQAVGAALPGGDPLSAALAAGETPSPEMVAAAGGRGNLDPTVRIALLASVIIGIAFLANLDRRHMLLRILPMEKPPSVLKAEARDLLNRLGYESEPRDEAMGIRLNRAYLNYLLGDRTPREELETIRRAPLQPVWFWYRQAKHSMKPTGILAVNVTADDPPPLEPGMISVSLDAGGRLVGFRAVPAGGDTTWAPWSDSKWEGILAETGLDYAGFERDTLNWSPSILHDSVGVWRRTLVEGTEGPVSVRAAAYRGRLVEFELSFGDPDSPLAASMTDAGAPSQVGWLMVSAVSELVLLILLIVGVVYLLRQIFGRTRDPRGARKLALFAFVVFIVYHLLGAHYPARAFPTLVRLLGWWPLRLGGSALALSVIVWTVYVAVEPYVRSSKPHNITSWNRLLSGRIRDPLLGRDLLIGSVAGVFAGFLNLLADPPLVSLAMHTMYRNLWRWNTLLGGRHAVAEAGRILFIVVWILLLYLLVMSMALAVLRRSRIGGTLLITFFAVSSVFMLTSLGAAFGLTGIQLVTVTCLSAASTGLTILVLRYLRLPAIVVSVWTGLASTAFPLTLDFSTWYAGVTIFGMVLLLLPPLYGFWTSGGRRPRLAEQSRTASS